MLEQLLPPDALDRFLRDHWPRRPFAFCEGSHDRLPELFASGPLSGLSQICGVYRGAVQIAGGRTFDFDQLEVGGQDPRRLFSIGLPVFFHSVAEQIPAAVEWAEGLARDLEVPSSRVRLAVFATPAGRGLPPHFDGTDNFILQIEGKKRVSFAPIEPPPFPVEQYSPYHRNALAHHCTFTDGLPDAPEQMSSVVLEPGSLLFLPRGTWHATDCLEPSFSVSIVVDTPKPIDVLLEFLRFALVGDRAWREPIDRVTGAGRTAARARLGQLLRGLGERLISLDPGELLRFAPLDRGAPPGPGDRFLREPLTAMHVETSPSGARQLRLTSPWNDDESLLTLPAALLPVIEWISARRASFGLDDLLARFPGVDAGKLAELVGLLVEGDALTRLPAPAITVDDPAA